MQLNVPSYLKNTYLFELKTKVINKKDNMVEFEDTIFHPQGGGQPNDKGWIEFNKNNSIIKSEVQQALSERESGRIYYKFNQAQDIEIGDEIIMLIDQQTRVNHAKIHSAGHILDLAVQRLKYEWQTAKGYHFADNPYVQYKGKLESAQKVVQEVNKEIQNILNEKIQTKKEVFSYDEAVKMGLIPETFKTPLIRVVHFGTSSCPCGGTHVHNTSEINNLKITKAQKKGKSIKLFYSVD